MLYHHHHLQRDALEVDRLKTDLGLALWQWVSHFPKEKEYCTLSCNILHILHICLPLHCVPSPCGAQRLPRPCICWTHPQGINDALPAVNRQVMFLYLYLYLSEPIQSSQLSNHVCVFVFVLCLYSAEHIHRALTMQDNSQVMFLYFPFVFVFVFGIDHTHTTCNAFNSHVMVVFAHVFVFGRHIRKMFERLHCATG